jgi:hypothetical protein
LVNVAGYAVFFDRIGGQGAAAQAINQRSGGYLDPAIAAEFPAQAATAVGTNRRRRSL